MIDLDTKITNMRKLGKIHATILEELKSRCRPGIKKLEIEEYFKELLNKFPGIRSACKGYKPAGYRNPYPTNLCIAKNEEAIHIPPNKSVIEEGDLVTIDLVLTDGLVYTDAAISFIVGETRKKSRIKLLQTAYNALYSAINKLKDGTNVGKLSFTIYSIVKKAGFDVLKEYGGHGIGIQMWEDPFIPNYGDPYEGPILSEGDTLAIEPLVCEGDDRLEYLDEWSTRTLDRKDFVQVEHTVLVLKDKAEILTAFD